MTRTPLALLGALALLLAGCGEKDGDDTGHGHSGPHGDDSATDDSAEPEGIAIAGTYTDSFDGTHTITDTLWDQGYASFNISQYDNAAAYAIAQNASTNDYSPDLWSRFDWHLEGADLYYCQTAYEAETEQDALDTPAANGADLAGGCGGFPWTELTPS
ncbi:MAG: hypothetical protein H6741_28445 [Alphaproteobacteria bacterium]|nr:hypothetical protein [Alphaproteobacteria bacterium]MCB9796647.1 hypothetical protein [Alphaproteobacteria bacterium]